MVVIRQTTKLRAGAASFAAPAIELFEGTGELSAGAATLQGTGTVGISGNPSWVASAPILEWRQFPNTKFSSVNVQPRYAYPANGDGPNANINAYSGCALREWGSTKELVHFGGGHANSGYNFVAKFVFSNNNPFWTISVPHSAEADVRPLPNPDGTLPHGVRRYLDDKWSSDHTYWILYHMGPVRDETWKVGSGSAYGNGSSGGRFVERLAHDPDVMLPSADCPLQAIGTNFPALSMAQHRNTKAIYILTNGSQFCRVNPDYTFTTIAGVAISVAIDIPIAVDPVRNRVLKPPNPGDTRWWTIDCATGAVTQRTVTGYTDFSLVQGKLLWDHRNDRFIGVQLHATGCKLVAIDPTTFVASLIVTTGPQPFLTPGAGLFGKVHIVEDYGMLILVRHSSDDVYYIKLYEVGVSAQIPVGLNSTSAGTKPFRFAMPIKKGDIPDGLGLEMDLSAYQTHIPNKWADNSAKIAWVAGYADLQANVTKQLTGRPGTAPTGVNVQESALAAKAPNVVLEFIADGPSGVSGTVNLVPLIGNATSAKGTPGRLETVWEGPQYSEWVYYSQVGSDAHLAAFIQAGLFKNGELWLCLSAENGWLDVAGPGTKNYRLRITVNNTVRFDDWVYHFESTSMTRIDNTTIQIPEDVRDRFPVGARVRTFGSVTAFGTVQTVSLVGGNTQISVLWDAGATTPNPLTRIQSLGHPHHTGWGMEFWYDADPDVVPVHDPSYIQSTRLVHRYLPTGQIDPAAYNGLAQAQAHPFDLCNNTKTMGAGGYDDTIGHETNWGAIHVCSGARASYKAVIANAFAYRAYHICYRDEATMRPPLMTTKPTKGISQTRPGIRNLGSSQAPTPTPSGSVGYLWSSSHHPNPAYLAYLLSGNIYHLRTSQFLACTVTLARSTGSRQGALCIASGQVREIAWEQRSLVQTMVITPDADTTFRDEYRTILENNFTYYNNRRFGPGWNNNALGIWHVFSAHGQEGPDAQQPGDAYWHEPLWMHDFANYVLHWAARMELLSGAPLEALKALRNFGHKNVLWRLGSQAADQYCYRQAARTNHPVLAPEKGPEAGGVWLTPGQIWEALFGPNTDCAAGSSVVGAYADGPEGFSFSNWGNMFPALAGAVDDEIDEPGSAPGALVCLNRLRSASNFQSNCNFFKVRPVWAIIPRNV